MNGMRMADPPAGGMPNMPPETGGMASSEQCVPLDALAEADEAEQLQNPEVGDPVTYTVDGKVTRVDGKNAYVKVENVNGKPVDRASEAPGADQAAENYAALEGEAQARGPM